MKRELPDFSDTKIAFQWRSTPKLMESHLVFSALGNQSLVKTSTKMISAALRYHLPITPLVKHTVFRQFCGGTFIEDCRPLVHRMAEYGVKSILDYSVEACEREKDLDAVAAEICRTIDFAKANTEVPFSAFKITGIIGFGLLEKVAAKTPLTENENKEFERGKIRLNKICEHAHKNDIPVLIDAEETWIQDGLDALALDMMNRYNQKRCIVYNTLQMYRHDRLVYLKELHEKAKNQGFIFGAKLVRGAYMEKERERAARLGYPSPIHANKAATDHDYNEAARYCIEHLSRIGLFLGTHNEESCALVAMMMDRKDIPRQHHDINFSQLYGMSDHISFNLAAAGYNVAKYLPYGPVKSVLPYLFRRAEENSSIQGQAGRELQLIRKELNRRCHK